MPEQASEQNDVMELDGGSMKRKILGELEEPDTMLHLAKWELQEKHFFMQSWLS
jgi:periodic tryptophan protein 2